MSKRKTKRSPHHPADLTRPEGRRRARSELIWGDHGFLRLRFSNLHRVSGELWRSNQPSPEQVRAHKASRDIRTIVNLRGPSPRGFYLLEKEACEALDIDLVDYQVFSRDTPTADTVLGVQDLFATIAYPALIHCKSGADRAGLMSALYLIARQNRPVSEAAGQLSLRYLHVRQGKTGLLDAFFAAALEAGADTPGDFFNWVASDYDPAAVKAKFLTERGRALDLDRLLGRE